MWIELRVLARFAYMFLFTLIAVSYACAGDPVPASQQFRASVDAPAYMAPYMRPIEKQTPKRSRVVDKKFIGMSALMMGLTVADIESTQHCLGNHTCRELNPLLPRSHAGMYAVNVPINVAAMYLSYRLKAGGHRAWWIAPMVISGAHGVGAGFIF